MAKKRGTATTRMKYGSTPHKVKDQKARYIPSIRNSPWAKFTTRMMPKMSVSPTAMRA
jgi:hypothetical protein